MLILPRRFSRQPQQSVQIDRSNPLSTGIVEYIIPHLLASSSGVRPVKFGGGQTIGPDVAGDALVSSASADYWEYPGEFSQLAPPYTIVTLYRLTGTNGRLAGNFAASTYGYSFLPNASNFRFGIAKSGANTILTGSAISTALKLDVGVVESATASYYENGIRTATSAHAGTTTPGGTQYFRIGADNGGTAGLASRVFLVLFYKRALSAAEISALHINPWQVFKAPERSFYPTAASAPDSVTVSAAWTEDADTASIAGSLLASAGAAWLESDDAASLSASVRINASAGWVEQSDTAAITAVAQVSASAAWSETDDAVSISATVENGISASAAWTEDSDVAAVVAAIQIESSAAWTEANDTASIAASVGDSVAISVAWTEQSDSVAALATVRVDASIGWAEEADIAGFSASVLASAGIAWAEDSDTAAAEITVSAPPSASIGWTESSDVVAITMQNAGVAYARAPAGSGYTPQRIETQTRPASSNTARPISTQRNSR